MKQLVVFFFFFTISLQAQFQINGIVKDAATKKGLPFATLTTENGLSTISDVDGKFYFSLALQPQTLKVSYVGYTKKTISIKEPKSYLLILLSPKTDEIKEVVISNANPATAVIKKVIQKRLFLSRRLECFIRFTGSCIG